MQRFRFAQLDLASAPRPADMGGFSLWRTSTSSLALRTLDCSQMSAVSAGSTGEREADVEM